MIENTHVVTTQFHNLHSTTICELSTRAQLLDVDRSSTLNFRQLLIGIGLINSKRVTEKLALLYILHLPELLSRQEVEMLERPLPKPSANATTGGTTTTHSRSAAGSIDLEEAAEAESFFGYEHDIYRM